MREADLEGSGKLKRGGRERFCLFQRTESADTELWSEAGFLKSGELGGGGV